MHEPHARDAQRHPFAGWVEGLAFGQGDGRIWFVPPATLCVEMHAARVDVPVARAYMETIRAVREAERESIVRAGGLRLYQDFRSLRVIERPARAFLARAALEDFGHWDLACNKIALAPRNPIVRSAIQLLGAIVVKTGLLGFELVDDLALELERDGIAPPEAGSVHDERHAGYARRADHSPGRGDRGSFPP